MMHCPNCGKPADAAQQFCRACGMSLDTVGQLVAQHTSLTPVPRQNKAELERQIVRTMFRWITWGMILLGIGVLMIVFNKSFNVGGWLKFMASAVSLAGVGVATAGLLRAMNEGVSLSGKKEVKRLSSPPDTKSLPVREMPAAVPSVTEHTTKLLPVDETPTNKVIDSNGRE